MKSIIELNFNIYPALNAKEAAEQRKICTLVKRPTIILS